MIPLTNVDFDGARLKRGTGVVVFTADWCGFCRRFLRDHGAALDALPVPAFNADVSEDEDPLWDAFGFHVVPSIRLFKDGEIVWSKNGVTGLGLTGRDVETLKAKAREIAPGAP